MSDTDMRNWPRRVVDVLHGVRLDPRNVRLGTEHHATEREIIVDLFKNERAMELLKNILQVGFLTHETPIALERDGELVVVEGNRRVAALKAIQNPNLAPDGESQRVESLVRQSRFTREEMAELEFVIAPSQEVADQVIAVIHTGRQRRPWSRSRQAEFFQAQLDDGKTVEELVQQFPTIKVRELLVRSGVLKLFRQVDYPDPELSRFVKGAKFPVTVLERLYRGEEFQRLAGISIEPSEARVRIVGDRDDFETVAQHLIADIKDKKVTTRTLNKVESEDYRNTISRLARAVGDPETAAAPAAQDGAEVTDQPIRRRRRQVTPERLAGTDDFPVAPGFLPSVYICLDELRAINVRRFPNATGDLLRTFLEKSIKAFGRTSPDNVPMSNDRRKQLKDCLNWLSAYYSNRDADLHQCVERAKDLRIGEADGEPATKQLLDAVNHNPAIVVSDRDAHDLWNAIRPIIADILKPRA